ncbi:MAG: oxygen-insensitive NAD(P)H nitroreductase [Hyphomicrobiales bacterium]|nr:MAG: oxygen-insensitive NAD(P)H nitroreductase [Hyphomicrobiales bacterium]
MNIAQLATSRYTTKAFDPQRKIPGELIAQIYSLLRHSASSVNSQPWHFLVAQSDEAKMRVAKSTVPEFAFNEQKILQASHVVVLCARKDMDEAHLQSILQQEVRDGRLGSEEARVGQDRSRRFFIDLNRKAAGGIGPWIDRQVYLSLGTLLLGVRALGIDACPMEGANFQKIDAEFDLGAKNLRSIVVVSLGYRSEADLNAKMQKSRLPEADVITTL